jgi:hypothetical protein
MSKSDLAIGKVINRSIFSVVIYSTVLFASLYLPLLVKNLLTGSAGPNTRFVAATILCPVAFLILGACGGRYLFSVHAILTTLVGLWAWISYPENPPMNFVRQISYDLEPALGILYLAGLVFSIRIDAFQISRKEQ